MSCAALSTALCYACIQARSGEANHLLAVGFSFISCLGLFFLESHAYAMSEPLFLLLLLAGLYFYLARTAERKRSLLVSALFIGFAGITRYAGVVWMAAIASTICLMVKPFSQALRRAALFSVVAATPLSLVMLWNHIRYGSSTNRDLVLHRIPLDTLREGALTICSWFVPYRILELYPMVPYVGVLLLLVALFTLGAWAYRRKALDVLILLVCGFAYLAFLLVSVALLDVSIMFSQRMLAPFGLMVLLAVALYFSGFPVGGKRRIVLRLAVLYMLLFSVYRASAFVSNGFRNGFGYNSSNWNASLLIQAVESTDGDIPFYSNAADAFNLRGHRMVEWIPAEARSTSYRPLKEFDSDYEAMISALRNGGAMLVDVNLRYWPPYIPVAGKIISEAGLAPILLAAEGVIYSRADNPRNDLLLKTAERLNNEHTERHLTVNQVVK